MTTLIHSSHRQVATVTTPPAVDHLLTTIDCAECWPSLVPREVELGLWEVEVTHGPQCDLPKEVIYA